MTHQPDSLHRLERIYHIACELLLQGDGGEKVFRIWEQCEIALAAAGKLPMRTAPCPDCETSGENYGCPKCYGGALVPNRMEWNDGEWVVDDEIGKDWVRV